MEIELYSNVGFTTLSRENRGRTLIFGTDDTAGDEIIVPRYTDGALEGEDDVYYFVCRRQGCVNVVPEDTTVNLVFLCDTNYEAGQRYVINRESTTNDWYIYKG
jgi:hypothetical protein